MEGWIKRFFKLLFFPLALLLILPFIILSRIESLFNKEGFFHAGGHLSALVPGTFGNLVRVAFTCGTLKKCHYNTFIGFGTFFSKRNTIIEKDVGIGAYCIIGECHLKENSKIASRVSIVSGLHEHGATSDFLEGKEEKSGIQVSIGPNCWIGEGALIGNTVGSHTVVSMGSVILKEVNNNTMAMGNPARLLPLK